MFWTRRKRIRKEDGGDKKESVECEKETAAYLNLGSFITEYKNLMGDIRKEAMWHPDFADLRQQRDQTESELEKLKLKFDLLDSSLRHNIMEKRKEIGLERQEQGVRKLDGFIDALDEALSTRDNWPSLNVSGSAVRDLYVNLWDLEDVFPPSRREKFILMLHKHF